MELKMDPERRRQVLRPVMLRFVLLTFGVPLLSLVLMFALPREVYYGKPLAYLLGLGIFSFLPFLCIAGGLCPLLQREVPHPAGVCVSGSAGVHLLFRKPGQPYR